MSFLVALAVLATVVALGILGVLGAVLTGAVAIVVATTVATVAVLARAGRWALGVVPGLGFAFLRAAAVFAVATLAILAVRAMAAPSAAEANDPCRLPALGFALSGVEKAPGPLTDELVEAFIQIVLADTVRRRSALAVGRQPVDCPLLPATPTRPTSAPRAPL